MRLACCSYDLKALPMRILDHPDCSVRLPMAFRFLTPIFMARRLPLALELLYRPRMRTACVSHALRPWCSRGMSHVFRTCRTLRQSQPPEISPSCEFLKMNTGKVEFAYLSWFHPLTLQLFLPLATPTGRKSAFFLHFLPPACAKDAEALHHIFPFTRGPGLTCVRVFRQKLQ
jgi:hypothetical protein